MKPDIKKVAENFSAAAATYDENAVLQGEIAQELIADLPVLQDVRDILDAGCGTGRLTRALALKYQQARVLGIDLAAGMIKYAAEHNSGQGICYQEADLGSFRQREAFDLIFSSSSLQWLTDLKAAVTSLADSLKSGGCLAVSTFLAGTFREFYSLSGSEDEVPLPDFDEIKSFITGAGLTLVSEYRGSRTMYFRDFMTFLKRHKKTGALNPVRKGRLNYEGFMKIMNGYNDKWRDERGLPVTYEYCRLVSIRK